MKRNRRKGVKRSQSGITLVELIVAMAVTLIIVASLVGFFFIQTRHFAQQSEVVEIQEDARSGLQMMIGELFMAGYDPTRDSNAGMISADASSVQFSQDHNGDGDIADSNENIIYAFNSADQQVERNGEPLAENIQALTFKYFDADDLELTSLPLSPADLAKLRRVVMTLTAVSRDGEQNRTFSSQVQPRNLGLAP